MDYFLYITPGMAAHTCSPSPGKLEGWRLRIWGQCELQIKFKPSLGYPVRSISEKQSKRNVFLETRYTTMSVYLIIFNCPVNCPVKMVTFMLWILATFFKSLHKQKFAKFYAVFMISCRHNTEKQSDLQRKAQFVRIIQVYRLLKGSLDR